MYLPKQSSNSCLLALQHYSNILQEPTSNIKLTRDCTKGKCLGFPLEIVVFNLQQSNSVFFLEIRVFPYKKKKKVDKISYFYPTKNLCSKSSLSGVNMKKSGNKRAATAVKFVSFSFR